MRGNLGKKFSEEHKKKISLALKGKKFSKSHRTKLSKAAKNRSPETRRRISESHKELSHTQTEETKQKIRAALKGRVLSKLTEDGRRRKSIFQKNYMTGRKRSPETRDKLSKAALARFKSGKKGYTNTNIEVLLQEELKRRKIDFRTQEEVECHSVDIFIPSRNLIIEADGCLWHYCPICNKNAFTEVGVKKRHADTDKTEKFRRAGFHVARFWGHEILKSPSDCIDRI